MAIVGAREQRVRALQWIALIRAVQERRAGDEAATANTAIAGSRGILDRSLKDRTDASHAWARVAAVNGILDPGLMALWARQIRMCDERILLAEEKCAEMEEKRQKALSKWYCAKLQVQQINDQLSVAKRLVLRHQEERRTAELADRVAHDWPTP